MNSHVGKRVRHHTRLALILDPRNGSGIHQGAPQTLEHLPEILPERLPLGRPPQDFAFDLASESRNLDDIRIVLKGLTGIVDVL